MNRSILAMLTSALLFSATAPQVQAFEAGDVLVRLRAVVVAPNDGGRNTGIVPSLATGSVDVGDAYVPEVDLTYFFSPSIAVETICCAARHSIKGSGAIAGLGKIGHTWVTPFTLNAQYHADVGGVKPYVGIGPSWALFYGEGETASLQGAIGAAKLNVRNKVGFDLQAGLDIPLSEKWFLNADFKYYFLKPSATLTGGALTAQQSFRIKLDPIIAGIGIGYKF